MTSVDNQELFQKYYQTEYDFNTTSLSLTEIDDIKELVSEKRVKYALAPMGEKIFDWILEQSPDIRFELVDFESDKIDGLLYIPSSKSKKSYIVLNSKKPLINQIFTAAHEYYHYIKDYARIKSEPYICNFLALKDVNEKKASRFAAEFLLPEVALQNEVKFMRKRFGGLKRKPDNFDAYAVLSIYLTMKYQLPLKAVIYRLFEEHYIDNIDEYIQNYEFIKSVLLEIKVFDKEVNHLYSNENLHIEANSLVYRQMKIAYEAGMASRDEIMQDAHTLGLDEEIVADFFDKISDEDEEEDDSEIMDYLQKVWGQKL